jgi:hypothetical protein
VLASLLAFVQNVAQSIGFVWRVLWRQTVWPVPLTGTTWLKPSSNLTWFWTAEGGQ